MERLNWPWKALLFLIAALCVALLFAPNDVWGGSGQPDYATSAPARYCAEQNPNWRPYAGYVGADGKLEIVCGPNNTPSTKGQAEAFCWDKFGEQLKGGLPNGIFWCKEPDEHGA